MPHRSTRSGSSRHTIHFAVVGTAAVAGVALFATLPAMATPTPPAVPTVVVASAGNASGAAPANGAPQLDDLDVPAEPDGCSAAQSRERDRQVELLVAEQEAETRVIETVADGSAPAKLDAIRDRAAIIVGRIEDLDARCDAEQAPPAAPPAEAPAEAPVGEAPAEPADEAPDDPAAEPAPAGLTGRQLAPLAIACAEVDFGGAAAAAVDRATRELSSNEDQLNERLENEFPRFSARVAREANPEAARTEFARLADGLAGTLEDRRRAILDRAGDGLADGFADTCEVVEAD